LKSFLFNYHFVVFLWQLRQNAAALCSVTLATMLTTLVDKIVDILQICALVNSVTLTELSKVHVQFVHNHKSHSSLCLTFSLSTKCDAWCRPTVYILYVGDAYCSNMIVT